METTVAMMFKERIANMPDDIADKDIMAYAKNILKEIKDENKKKKAEEAQKNKKKRVAKKPVAKLDENGNEIPKKLTKYQQYIKDNQKRVADENPELTNTQRFAKLAEEWAEYKKTIIVEEKNDDSDVVVSDNEKEKGNEESGSEEPKEPTEPMVPMVPTETIEPNKPMDTSDTSNASDAGDAGEPKEQTIKEEKPAKKKAASKKKV